MIRVLKSATVLALFAIGAPALAVERTVETGYNLHSREIKIKIQDSEESPQACDYHISGMTYDAKNKILAIDLGEEPFRPQGLA